MVGRFVVFLSLVTALLVFCIAAAAPQAARAQAAGATDAERLRELERRLETSQKLIERLSERIGELERAAAPKSKAETAPPTMAEQAKSIATLQESVEQISSGLSRTVTNTGVPIHGFADAGTAWSSRQDRIRLRGFGVGTLDLYLAPQFGDHVKSLVEIALEYGADGAGEIDAERMQLGYVLDDSMTLWAGRFHTPIGLWNTAYHHGANLQTSIYRPRFIDFEDKEGVLPVHSVGVWGSGKIGLGQEKLSYDAYLANGPTIRHGRLDYNAFSDDNGSKLFGFNLNWDPKATLRGASVGLHAFRTTADTRLATGALHSRTRVRMLGGYLGYDAHGWEGMAEYYRFANSDLGTGTRRSSQAGYLQIGRNYGTLTPYARYERAALDGADNFFVAQRVGRSYTRGSIGARYDLDARAALKVELGVTREDASLLIDETGAAIATGQARYRRLAVQYSIAF
ncbi:MAG: hypothetical protein ABL900_18075 [Burkholderiaceae bacterium]